MKYFWILIFVFSSLVLFGDNIVIQTVNGEIVIDLNEVESIRFSDDTSGEDIANFVNVLQIHSLMSYPNPFTLKNTRNPGTTIKFELSEAGKTTVDVYNIKGQKVKSLLKDELQKGQHNIHWDGTNNSGSKIASGVYFYKISSNGYNVINKMIHVK